MTALSLPVLALAVGGGVDLTRAYAVRQHLANVVELSCSQSALEISYLRGLEDNKGKAASAFVSVADAVSARRLAASGDLGVIANSISGDTLTVSGRAESQNAFASILGAATLPVGASRQCDVGGGIPGNGRGSVLFMESFETEHKVASNSWGVLQNWNGWVTEGGGVEINGIPSLSAGTIRFGNFFAELDSHCYVAGCQSNSALSRIMRLTPGDYEVRYWYISRVRNADPTWAGVVGCGDAGQIQPYRAWNQETNRIDFYVEKEGAYTFSPANIMDSCVYTDHWVERRVKFRVASEANYRISWRAAGLQDTLGGLIDYIRICSGICP